MDSLLTDSDLGKTTHYRETYDPSLLFTIPRQTNRSALGLSVSDNRNNSDPQPLPFKGVDVWNAYELSWLDAHGKPVVALATFTVPCTSPHLFESKSLKLYLNSFAMTKFPEPAAVRDTLSNDLQAATQAEVAISLEVLHFYQQVALEPLRGMCLDTLEIFVDCYEVTPNFLQRDPNKAALVEECLYSNLFRSHCPVTNQPDWASIEIAYTGHAIDHAGLLRYLISYRQHQDFHETCVERIFLDVMRHCQPQTLTVHGRFTRRGGIDINPYRSTATTVPKNLRLSRQ